MPNHLAIKHLSMDIYTAFGRMRGLWLLARKLRVRYPGAMYHVMSRGDRRDAIFENDDDRRLFLETLGQACRKTDWEVHGW